MLSVARVKKILDDPSLTDEQIEDIRDGFHNLAELIFDDWYEKNKQNEHENRN